MGAAGEGVGGTRGVVRNSCQVPRKKRNPGAQTTPGQDAALPLRRCSSSCGRAALRLGLPPAFRLLAAAASSGGSSLPCERGPERQRGPLRRPPALCAACAALPAGGTVGQPPWSGPGARHLPEQRQGRWGLRGPCRASSQAAVYRLWCTDCGTPCQHAISAVPPYITQLRARRAPCTAWRKPACSRGLPCKRPANAPGLPHPCSAARPSFPSRCSPLRSLTCLASCWMQLGGSSWLAAARRLSMGSPYMCARSNSSCLVCRYLA